MKKLMFIITLGLILVSTPALAGFNFGTDTYEKVDNILIVNSLGDQVVESQFKHNGVDLGFNDFIPENAFKNNLYNEGYNKVYDYKPAGLDVVEVGYMGVRGDPRSYDADYVLREEYEKYSSQYQDIRIENNTTGIVNNTALINNETNQRIIGDNIIQNNINNEIVNRINNDNVLQNNINNVDARQTIVNNRQDTQINNNTSNINNNSQRINDTNNRVSELEETQEIVSGQIRVYDSKKWEVTMFVDYSLNRNMVDRTGVKIKFKFGKSYEEKMIEKLQYKVNTIVNN